MQAAKFAKRWPGPVFSFFAGDLSEDELLTKARSGADGATLLSRETEAHFYAALSCYSLRDHEKMLFHLHACVPQNMFEDIAAQGILKYMN